MIAFDWATPLAWGLVILGLVALVIFDIFND